MTTISGATAAPYDCNDLPALDPWELVVTAMPLLSQPARRHHQNCPKCSKKPRLTVSELMRCFAHARVEVGIRGA